MSVTLSLIRVCVTMTLMARPSAAAGHIQRMHRKVGKQMLVRSFLPSNLSTENPQNTLQQSFFVVGIRL